MTTDPLIPKTGKPSTGLRQTSVTFGHLDPEEAETRNLQVLDAGVGNRQRLGSENQSHYDRIHNMFMVNRPAPINRRSSSSDGNSQRLSSPSPPILKKAVSSSLRMVDTVRRVQMMERLKSMKSISGSLNSTSDDVASSPRPHVHRKQQASRAHELLSSIFVESQQESNAGLHDPTRHVAAFNSINPTADHSDDESQEVFGALSSDSEADDDPPNVSSLLPTNRQQPTTTGYDSIPRPVESSLWRIAQRRSNKKTYWRKFRRGGLRIWHSLATNFYPQLVCSCITYITIPLCTIAWILYYGLGNPEFDFLPGRATLSWWCNFVGRQVVTLELARLTQWIVLDWIILNTHWVARFLGPTVTMTAVESRGWPFVCACWGALDLLLLHGDNVFQVHWLYWTGFRIYDVANSGAYVLNSKEYLSALLAMIVAGLVTTAKRIFLSTTWGGRMLISFRPRMEKLLADMVIMEEITDLGENAELVVDVICGESGSVDHAKASLSDLVKGKRQAAKNLVWQSVASYSEEDLDHGDNESPGVNEEPARVPQSEPPVPSAAAPKGLSARTLSRTESGSIRLKKRLEYWEDPGDESFKDDFSVPEVLTFRHALTYFDDVHPFGEAFGSASTRDECIAASHTLFWKLVQCVPGSRSINFDVLAIVATNVDGSQDENKLKLIRRLFQPDANNELNLLAFVQSVDNIYKRLRYFRSAMRNATVIDRQLERFLNIFFYFVLLLMLLSIMHFNPWPLLVSITSLLVSVSFALGSSVSKYVEGILLIAVRRPFDLGDRILLCSPEGNETPGATSSWFVEDISLFSTTIRYAKTNEVSTVNNYSISLSRIVNCNRSANAIVMLEMKFSISILEDDKLKTFRDALEKYIGENPRIWDSLVYCRHDFFHPDVTEAYVFFTIAFKHRQSWQSAGRINLHRADLLRYIYELGQKLEIQYNTPPSRRLIVAPPTGRSLSAPVGSLRDDSMMGFPTLNIADIDEDKAYDSAPSSPARTQYIPVTGADSLAPVAI